MRCTTWTTLASLLLMALILPAAPGCASDDATPGATASGPDHHVVALGAAAAMRADVEDDDHDEYDEEEIPLSEVPDHVKRAALAAVPGIILEEAEREYEGGVLVYELEGERDGIEYEVEVTAEGTVLEVETDGEDDDD